MMLDAYYCTTAGVVQGRARHVTPRTHLLLQYSRACRGASSFEDCGRGKIHLIHQAHGWCLALISLCHEIKLAPARGTRTHTRTTRRKVNTRRGAPSTVGQHWRGFEILHCAVLLFCWYRSGRAGLARYCASPTVDSKIGHLVCAQ